MLAPWSGTSDSSTVGSNLLLSNHPVCGIFRRAPPADEDNEDIRWWHLRTFLVLTDPRLWLGLSKMHKVLGCDEKWCWGRPWCAPTERSWTLCFGPVPALNAHWTSFLFQNYAQALWGLSTLTFRQPPLSVCSPHFSMMAFFPRPWFSPWVFHAVHFDRNVHYHIGSFQSQGTETQLNMI